MYTFSLDFAEINLKIALDSAVIWYYNDNSSYSYIVLKNMRLAKLAL